MPSCICCFFRLELLMNQLAQCVRYRGIEHLQPRTDIALEVDSQCAPAALGQHVEVAAGLCRLDDAEARLLSGDRKILRIVSGDLQEHAAVRPALVGLAGRMQEARAELGASGEMLLVAHPDTHLLK